MLIETLILGGIFLAGSKTGKQFVQDMKALFRSLTPEKATAGAGEMRNLQIKQIVFGGEEVEVSAVEQKAKKDLAIAAGTLGSVTAGMLLPPFILVSVAGFIYMTRDFYRDAYRVLVKERRVSMDILHALLMTGVLLGGFLLAGALTACVVMLVRWLMVKTEDHSKKKLANLFGKQPRFVWIQVCEGQDQQIPFEQLKAGDVVVVNAGEMIPVDGRIVRGHASIDSQMLTGEFQPAEKTLADRVFTSTVVLKGKIWIQVEKAGQDTIAAQIAEVLNRTTDYKASIRSESREFDSLSLPMCVLGGIALPIVGLNSTLGFLWNVPGVRMGFFGPLSMLNFLHLSSRDGILIKDGRSLELLNRVDTVVFDKTGTLTLQQPQVDRIHICNGLPEDELLRYAAAAEDKQTHPVARAIQSEASRRDLTLPAIENATYQIGYGIKVQLPDRVVRVGSSEFMEIEKVHIPDKIKECRDRCHRHGHSLVMVALDDELAGAIELRPTIRSEAKAVIDSLRRRNLSMSIISGDHDAPAKRLAEELGIEHYFASTLPENKAKLIGKLQQEGRFVCFVGDGINDAIALQQANVSVSLRGATMIATDTAQIVLMHESLGQLARLFDLAEEFKGNMTSSFKISTIPSAICMAGSFLFQWSFLTSVAIGLGAFALGLGNVMRPLFNPDLNNVDRRTPPLLPAPEPKEA